jgi:hypothetical protein
MRNIFYQTVYNEHNNQINIFNTELNKKHTCPIILLRHPALTLTLRTLTVLAINPVQ